MQPLFSDGQINSMVSPLLNPSLPSSLPPSLLTTENRKLLSVDNLNNILAVCYQSKFERHSDTFSLATFYLISVLKCFVYKSEEQVPFQNLTILITSDTFEDLKKEIHSFRYLKSLPLFLSNIKSFLILFIFFVENIFQS